ncbi:MAG: hypothetical protein K0R62_8302 [Nonomuraea muscovyensis]|nr:hypothetical protein [Nonomuraea muscovyensis]
MRGPDLRSPTPNQSYMTSRVMRPVLLDVEDLKDAGASVVRALNFYHDRDPGTPRLPPTVSFELQRWEGPHLVPAEELGDLSVPDRNNLRLVIVDNDGIRVSFEAKTSLWDTSTMEPWGQQAIEAGAKRLLDAGRARIEWARFNSVLPWAYIAVTVLAWIWVSLTAPLVPAAHVIFLLALVGLTIGAWKLSETLERRSLSRVSPTIFRGESRAATHSRRADDHADTRVALKSIAGTVAGLFIIGVIWWALTGNVTGAPSPTSPTP